MRFATKSGTTITHRFLAEVVPDDLRREQKSKPLEITGDRQGDKDESTHKRNFMLEVCVLSSNECIYQLLDLSINSNDSMRTVQWEKWMARNGVKCLDCCGQ